MISWKHARPRRNVFYYKRIFNTFSFNAVKNGLIFTTNYIFLNTYTLLKLLIYALFLWKSEHKKHMCTSWWRVVLACRAFPRSATCPWREEGDAVGTAAAGSRSRRRKVGNTWTEPGGHGGSYDLVGTRLILRWNHLLKLAHQNRYKTKSKRST